MTKTAVIGLDLGFSSTKLVFENESIHFPATIGNPSIIELQDIFGQSRNVLDNLSVTYDGRTYYVGSRALETANARQCIENDKTNSIHEKIIFQACLGLIENKSRLTELNIVTGLPVSDYQSQTLIDSVTMNLRGPRRVAFQDRQLDFNVPNVIVMPQGAGAYFDYLLNDNGEIKHEVQPYVSGIIVVIDIGYKTTDVITFVNGRYDSMRSFSITKGMLNIHIELQRIILSRHGRDFNLPKFNEICMNGYFTDGNNKVDIRGYLSEAAEPIGMLLVNEINTKLIDPRDVTRIIGAGGTTTLLSAYFKDYYDDIYITLPEPQLANARGYRKYGVAQYEKNNKNMSNKG